MKAREKMRECTQDGIEALDGDVRCVSVRLVNGAQKLAAMDEKLAEFDAHFAALDRRFADLDARFAAFNAHYEAMRGQISALEKETQKACRMAQEMRRGTAYIDARLEALEMAALAAELIPQKHLFLKESGGRDVLH